MKKLSEGYQTLRSPIKGYVLVPEEVKEDKKEHIALPAVPAVSDSKLILAKSRATGLRSSKEREGVIPLLPPKLDTTPVYSAVFRFQNTNATVSTVTAAQLLTVPGIIGTATNSTGSSIASSVKIRSIKIWPAAGTNAEVSWNAGSGITYQKDSSVDTTTPTGVTAGTGPLYLRPPSQSFGGFWLSPTLTTTTIFAINCGVGSVVDVHLDFVTCNNSGGQSISLTTVVVGSFYYTHLDSTNRYVPVGRPSTS
jgi:hypothetical protein